VINELATNTVKHTLKERDTAHINVDIELSDNRIRCEFRDDGPGFPDDVLRLERQNVGFDLIRFIVRDGLRGELELRNEDGAVAVFWLNAHVPLNGG
jgi:two-component sensor histidine kinase